MIMECSFSILYHFMFILLTLFYFCILLLNFAHLGSTFVLNAGTEKRAFSQFSKRFVALKIMYFGQRYKLLLL